MRMLAGCKDNVRRSASIFPDEARIGIARRGPVANQHYTYTSALTAYLTLLCSSNLIIGRAWAAEVALTWQRPTNNVDDSVLTNLDS